MDGNGRWAKQKGLSRVRGHQSGAKVVNEIVREAAKIGIKQLTLYAFSQENWKRPKYEIGFLMRLLNKYIRKEEKEIMDNNIRFTTIGRIEEFPKKTQELIKEITAKSSTNTGMKLCLALNYGARAELVDAAKKIAQEVKEGKIKPEDITNETLQQHLYDPQMPDPDLLIRTSGEYRLSNFLLYQIAYTEFYITPVLWPDFTVKHFHEAIEEYNRRERRFGGI